MSERVSFDQFIPELVKALRSGEYKQTRGLLHRHEARLLTDVGGSKLVVDDSYCCLGVACVVLMNEFKLPIKADGLDQEGVTGGRYGRSTGHDPTAQSGLLPQSIAEMIGLPSQNDIFVICKGSIGSWVVSSFAEVNDDGKSFEFIADVIEAQPKGWDGTAEWCRSEANRLNDANV